MAPWYPGDEEQEEEPRAGCSQAALTSQLQGGRLARQTNEGGAQPWYPSEAELGGLPDSDGERSVVSLSMITPASGIHYGSAEGLAECQNWQPAPASRVRWASPVPGATGPGGGMAVDDAVADVSGSAQTPLLRLYGARSFHQSARHGSRVEEIAVDGSSSLARPSPVPIVGLGQRRPTASEPVARRQEEPAQEKGGGKKQKVDYMNNPHLCLTAQEQLDKARTEAAAELVAAVPWQLTTLGKPDAPGPGGFERTAEERLTALVRAVYVKGPSRNKMAAGMLNKMATFKSERTGGARLAARFVPDPGRVHGGVQGALRENQRARNAGQPDARQHPLAAPAGSGGAVAG